MKTIIFRTMGAGNIGYGHYFRCLSLAKAFLHKEPTIIIKFIINADLEALLSISGFDYIINDDFNKDVAIIKQLNPAIIIFDSYLASDDYLSGLKNLSMLMIFDDNDDIYDISIPDIVLNGNIHAEDLNYKKRKNGLYLLGTDYLVMKEEYWEKEYSNIFSDSNLLKNTVMITTGGSDSYGIAIRILNTIIRTKCKKTVIIGPSYTEDNIRSLETIANNSCDTELIYKPQSLKSHINKAKVVISAGGSTVYEVLSQKTTPIVFSLADNQDLICRKVNEKGIVYIGKYPNIDYTLLLKQVDRIMNDTSDFLDNKNFIIDGKGALRVAEIIMKEINSIE